MTHTKQLKTNFIIVPLLENEREKAVHFIEQDEVECTALMEHLQQSAEDVFVLKDVNRDIFCALFFIRTKSTLIYYLPFLKSNSKEENQFDEKQLNQIEKVITLFISSLKLFCVYGEETGGLYLNSILEKCNKKLIISKEYYLMTNDFSNEIFSTEIEIRDELVVKKCSLEDVEKLVELERGYRLEEVSITGKEEADNILQMVLRNYLSTQIIYSLFIENEEKKLPFAKAGTNARGKKYYQIGGVFCKKEMRNKGYMFYLMKFLLKEIQSENKIANLFVNVHNEAAKKVYEKLGFTLIGKYRISYFQK